MTDALTDASSPATLSYRLRAGDFVSIALPQAISAPSAFRRFNSPTATPTPAINRLPCCHVVCGPLIDPPALCDKRFRAFYRLPAACIAGPVSSPAAPIPERTLSAFGTPTLPTQQWRCLLPPWLFAPPPSQEVIHAAQPVGPVVSDPPPADIAIIPPGHPVSDGAIVAPSPLASPHRAALRDGRSPSRRENSESPTRYTPGNISRR